MIKILNIIFFIFSPLFCNSPQAHACGFCFSPADFTGIPQQAYRMIAPRKERLLRKGIIRALTAVLLAALLHTVGTGALLPPRHHIITQAK